MRIIDLLRYSRASIVVKLILLNLLILLAVAGVVLVNLVLSRQISNTLNMVIEHDVSQVIKNAKLTRDLHMVFAETHLLLYTFTERREILQTEGNRLVSLLQNSIAAHKTDAISDALVYFREMLEALLAQCAVIIQISDQIHALEHELDTMLSALDELVMNLIIERKVAGKEYELFALDQVGASLPDYRSLLLQIAMQLVHARRDYLSPTPVEEHYEQETLALFADLSASLLIATTAGDELAEPGQQLITAVKEYQETITELYQALRIFQRQFYGMNTAQAQVMRVMESVDQEVTQATGRIRENVADQIQTSRSATLFFSVIVIVVLLGGVGMYAVKITRPILHLTASAAAIADGKLDTPIDNRGDDEIGRLARSFVRMRDVVRAEMDALAEKNTALLVETTERKRAEESLRLLNEELEQRVNQRTLDLEMANKELKEFAYVVSHDLKAPLRGLSRLAQWLQSDYADKLGDDGQEQLDLLVTQTRRMNALIDGILHYSRVVHGSQREEPIDLNAFVPQVIAMLMPPPRITIRMTNELPVIHGDPIRVTQVFQNLLNNAVKFMDKSDGQINVDCEDNGNFWMFRVEDNGPGIAPNHHERIFQIFQTNSPQDQQESTGIGLTVVKKIVELYGGRIWVESTVGQGSRFSFTWPKQPQDQKRYVKVSAA